MSQLNIVATIIVNPEFQDDVQPIFKKLVEGSRKEPGCIRYELNQSIDNPCIYVVIESWQSKQAIDFHNAQPHFVEFANFAKTHVDRLQISIVKQVM